MEERPVAIDLFCGECGWSIGLLSAGFKVINDPLYHKFLAQQAL
jgi:hypothetical protein